MRESSDLVPNRRAQDVVDVLAFTGRVVASLGAFLKRPVEAGGANHARGIFEERIVMQNADNLGLDVGDAVEGIEEQPAGSFIQRERHGVDGEVAATQVVVNGRGGYQGSLARLLKAFGSRHADLSASIARQ